MMPLGVPAEIALLVSIESCPRFGFFFFDLTKLRDMDETNLLAQLRVVDWRLVRLESPLVGNSVQCKCKD